MNEKLIVKICTGTLCYVMGGAELQLLEEQLPEAVADKVYVAGTPCLDVCHRDSTRKAPFALVGEELVSEATIAKIIDAINKQLKY